MKRVAPFRRNSRVIDQFKPRHWKTFRLWAKKHQTLLGLTDDDDTGTLTYIRFKYKSHARHDRGEFAKGDVYLALAELINEVGGTEGLKHCEMVFYRYISSPEHSNLDVDYKALKRQIQSALQRYKSGEK